MIVSSIDVGLCRRSEKEVVDGLCLSYDLISGVCSETGCTCDAVTLTGEKSAESYCDGLPESQRFV